MTNFYLLIFFIKNFFKKTFSVPGILMAGMAIGLGLSIISAITVQTPNVQNGDLITAESWNKIKADLDALAAVAWDKTGGVMFYSTTGGTVGLGTDTISKDLKLDVEGKVGATHYCDEKGENCVTAAELYALVHPATPPVASGSKEFTTPGTYTWTVPAGITSINVALVSG